MPYFIYRLKPFSMLEKLAEYPSFKEASVEAKRLRTLVDPAKPGPIKIIFAETELHAEDLLSQVREREPGPPGDD
jgi:hypothetical protein